jgi:hypothetical protein
VRLHSLRINIQIIFTNQSDSTTIDDDYQSGCCEVHPSDYEWCNIKVAHLKVNQKLALLLKHSEFPD